jgi:hypothetical protein
VIYEDPYIDGGNKFVNLHTASEPSVNAEEEDGNE